MIPASFALGVPLAALLALVSAPAPAAASCLHGITLEKRAAPGPVSPPPYSYSGVTGPLRWHTLKPEYEVCKTGSNQSPINIRPGGPGVVVLRDAAQKPRLRYPRVPSVTLQNIGSTVQAHAKGETDFGGATWELQQFHFHTPSEHRVDEKWTPVEAHFVHTRSNAPPGTPSILVVGVFIEVATSTSGLANRLFERVLRVVRSIPRLNDAKNTESLEFEGLAVHVALNDVYQYSGSLTTPPCSEGVQWLVSAKPLQLDVNIFNEVKEVVRWNSRVEQGVPGEPNLLL